MKRATFDLGLRHLFYKNKLCIQYTCILYIFVFNNIYIISVFLRINSPWAIRKNPTSSAANQMRHLPKQMLAI